MTYSQHGYTLRRIEEVDLDMVLSWRNSPQIREKMYTDHIISKAEHLSWYARISDDENSRYFICERAGRPIGLVTFSQIDRMNAKAYWGFYLADESSPPGQGAAMEYLALDYAFDKLCVRKLLCEVFRFNKSVVKLHLKFGFRQEGLLERHIIKNEIPEDVVLLALFEEDWRESKDKLERICFRKNRHENR